MTAHTTNNDLLGELRALLEYQQDMGVKELPVVKRAMKGVPKVVAPHAAAPRAAARVKEPALQASGEKQAALDKLRVEIGACMRCKLSAGRTNLVFGVGNADARLLFIGEGPGRDEDQQGIPFVGRAGQLLTKIIGAMKMRREDVYIANIAKCRPPQNRAPEPDEVKECLPFLVRQVEIIEPRVIVCLGSISAQNFLGTEEKISQLRGHVQEWRGIPVMPTYHPAYLLRNPEAKKPVWEDMQQVMELLKGSDS